MIVFQIANIIGAQLEYTLFNKLLINEKTINIELYNQLIMASQFLIITTFNLAHWFFAYNYWALSWRIDLVSDRMPAEAYNFRLKIVNIMVCLLTVLMPVIEWLLFIFRKWKYYTIFAISENLSLVISCGILVSGFKRLIGVVKSVNSHVVDKAIITWNIIAYFFIVIANIV